MKEIIIKHTHIEIYPYTKGECDQLEWSLSTFDNLTHKRDEMGFTIYNDTLYVPRGVSIAYLEKLFDSPTTVSKIPDKYELTEKYEMTEQPRDIIQKDAIDFLNGDGNFKFSRGYSQLSLNLDTGDGKTYSVIKNIVDNRYRALIVVHTTEIKRQWIDAFAEMTTIPKNKIFDIKGSFDFNVDFSKYDIFIINHQTISSFIRMRGYHELSVAIRKMHVALKAIDEAHKFFKSTLRLDMLTNVMKTIYVTATFGRSQYRENKIFEKCMASVYKFGAETKDYECKHKHIVYMPIFYRSDMPFHEQPMLRTVKGLSATKFIDYAFKGDPKHTLEDILNDTLCRIADIGGRILITTSKIESMDTITRVVNMSFGGSRTVGAVNSKNKESVNIENGKKDVVISTIAGKGEGSNIKGLKFIINLVPFTSPIMFNQLAGRLRELADGEETYMIDLVDVSIADCERMYKSRYREAKKKCKKIIKDRKS